MSDWQTLQVITNGICISVTRTGGQNEGKPPLVLLHGITDSGLCWRRLALALAEDYDIIMPDARGHGRADAPQTGYSPDHHADDVAGLVRALGLERVLVVGHSMGAMNAAVLAADYPDRVRGLVLEDPPWHMHPPSAGYREQMVGEWRQRIMERQSSSVEALIAAQRVESPGWHEIEFADWAEAKQQTSPYVVGYISEARRSWREIAPWITCPTLLIHADNEAGAIVTPEVAAEAARLLPAGRVVHLGGAGHNIRREQFEAYLAVVAAFLAEAAAVP